MTLQNGYAVLIDTNRYAGNFERELCAYVTGQVGECEVGTPDPDYDYEVEFSEKVTQTNQDGCWRPCEIAVEPTTGLYNTVAIFFNDQPSASLMETIEVRSKNFCANHHTWMGKPDPITILNIRLVKVTTTQTITEIV